jgi:hypothetical protein
MDAVAMLQKPHKLYLGHSLTDFDEDRYTNQFWSAEFWKLDADGPTPFSEAAAASMFSEPHRPNFDLILTE